MKEHKALLEQINTLEILIKEYSKSNPKKAESFKNTLKKLKEVLSAKMEQAKKSKEQINYTLIAILPLEECPNCNSIKDIAEITPPSTVAPTNDLFKQIPNNYYINYSDALYRTFFTEPKYILNGLYQESVKIYYDYRNIYHDNFIITDKDTATAFASEFFAEKLPNKNVIPEMLYEDYKKLIVNINEDEMQECTPVAIFNNNGNFLLALKHNNSVYYTNFIYSLLIENLFMQSEDLNFHYFVFNNLIYFATSKSKTPVKKSDIKFREIKLFPEDKKELKQMIEEEIEKQGDNANLNHIDVSRITSMGALFSDSIFNGDISEWDVSNVTDMRFMFSSSKFNGNISKWNVGKATTMVGMFYNSKFNKDISKWNVSNVTDMSYIFDNSQFNGNISNWDVSKVENMGKMFFGTPFNQNISNWNVSNVKDMNYMFSVSLFNQDISQWDVSKVKNMEYMFASSPFNQDISKWKIKKKVKTTGMFNNSPLKDNPPKWYKETIIL